MQASIGKLPPNRTTILISLILLLGTAVLFWPVGKFEFVGYDDPFYITQNQHVLTGLKAENVAWAFGQVASEATYWHPISWMSHMLDCQLFGLNSGAHHYVNVFFHALNVLLLFLVLKKFTGSTWRSAAVAALFAVHPLQVETVAWVTERKNLLSTLFLFLTLLAYHRFVKKHDDATTSPAENGGIQSTFARMCTAEYLWVVVFFALGLMSKPMLVTVPCVLLLLDFWPLKRIAAAKCQASPDVKAHSFASLLIEKAPLFVFSAISSVITILAHQKLQIVVASQQVPFLIRLANAGLSYIRYIEKTLWPTDLMAIHPYPSVCPVIPSIVAALALLTITIVALVIRRNHPVFLVAWLWFLGTLVPVIGLLQVGGQAMADRFVYVPIIGLFVVVVWAVGELLSRVKPRQIIAGIALPVVVAGLSVASRQQMPYWHDSVALFQRAISITPENAIAHYNLGLSYLASVGKTEKAKEHFREALRISPNYVDARNNLAGALFAEEKYIEAAAEYSKILETDRDNALALFNLGIVFERGNQTLTAIDQFKRLTKAHPHHIEGWLKQISLYERDGRARDAADTLKAMLNANANSAEAHLAVGNYYMSQQKVADAANEFVTAVTLNPNDSNAHYAAANALGMTGRTSEALAHLKEAIRLNPDFTEAYFTLGMATAGQGKIEEALDHYRSAIKANKKFVPALVSLSWILASHQSDKIRNGSEALQLATRAVELTDGKDAIALDTLAAAYAEVGKFPKAVETAEKALTLLQNNAPPQQLDQMRGRLELYKKQQSYHGA